MEDRYLFRGIRVDNGEWIYGDIAHHDGVVSYIGQHPADGSMVVYDLRPETIGQCTGMKDCNGKRIFEGDIVRIVDDCLPVMGEPFPVEYVPSEGSYAAGFEPMQAFVYGSATGNPVTMVEVIGNIHENPGLLEVTQ